MHASKSQSFPVSILIVLIVGVSSSLVLAAGAQPGPDHEPMSLTGPDPETALMMRACPDDPLVPSRRDIAELEERLAALITKLEASVGSSPELRSYLLELQARTAALSGELRALVGPGPCSPLGLEPDSAPPQSLLESEISHLEREVHAVLFGAPAQRLSGTGAISGTITDTDTGTPLDGVLVRVYDRNGDYLLYSYSNAAGVYLTPAALDASSYYVKATKDSYISELYGGVHWRPTISEDEGVPVVVEEGLTTSGIDLSLEHGGSISGTISDDPAATPVAGATIRVYDGDKYFTTASSDGTGSYQSETILPSGTYYAWVSHASYINELYDDISCPIVYYCPPSGGAPITVSAGVVATGVDVALARGGSISGTLTAEGSGDPITDSYISFFNQDGRHTGSAYPDTLGSWQAAGLPIATYYAYTYNWAGYQNEIWQDIPCAGSCSSDDVLDGTPIPLVAGSDVSDIDFVLGTGGLISGVVTDVDTGLGIADISITVFDEGGSSVAYTSTGPDGVYLSDPGLTTGSYFVRALDQGSGQGYLGQLYDGIPCLPDCEVTTGTPVEVVSGTPTTGIDLVLQRGGRISGVVSDASDGEPINHMRVLFYNQNGAYLHDCYTDDSGSYTNRYGLPTGSYFTRTNDLDRQGFLEELFDDLLCHGSCTVTAGTPIAVSNGGVANADFALDQGGYLSGTVTDSTTGLPIENVEVTIFDSSGNHETRATTGVLGTYKSRDVLAPGTYYARAASTEGGSYITELYGGAPCVPTCDVTTGTPITVELSVDTNGIDFALAKGGSISGVVTDVESGEPLSSIYVNIYDSTGYPVCSSSTGSDGSYSSTIGLPAAEYFVTVRDFSGQHYLGELYDDIPYFWFTDELTGTPVTVSEATETPKIDFALQRGGTISGTVSDSYSADGSTLYDNAVVVHDDWGRQMSTGYVGVDGSYTIQYGLPTGTYYVRTINYSHDRYLDQLYDGLPCEDGCDVLVGDPVSVTVGLDTPDIDFTLDRAGSISGTVRLAESGAPATSTRVKLLDMSGGSIKTDWTDSSGEYSLDSLQPGSYYLQTDTSLSSYIDELYDGVLCIEGCSFHLDEATAVTITAAGEMVTGIDLALHPSHTLSGTVSDRATGEPLDAVVELYDAGGVRIAQDLSSFIIDVPSGVYFIKAWYTGYRSTLYDDIPCPGDSCHVTTGTPIVVDEDDITGIDMALDRYATISGTVRDQGSNRPISAAEAGPDAEVWLFDAAGTFVTHAALDDGGGYSFSSVEPGTYFVRTYSWQGWVDELYDDYPCPLGSGCDVTTGTPIVCSFGSEITGIDFVLSTTPDATPPLNPTLASSSHEPGVWSTDSLLVIEWSGASDAASRIVGYSVLLDTSPLTEPDEVVDVVQGVDPHGFASGLSEGEAYTFHLRTCDSWGNCSDAVHLGPFMVDQTPPGPVGDIASSHSPGEPSSDRSIELWWQAASDGESGVAGYAAVLDDQPDSGCPGVITTTTQDLNVIGLADGSWYLHVCAVDNVGTWGPVSTAGPYVIASEELFSDGFESGGTTAWSSVAASQTIEESRVGATAAEVALESR